MPSLPKGLSVKILGGKEVADAILEVSGSKAAATAAAEVLVPDLRRHSRVLSGTLQASWAAADGAITNYVGYASYQELGTQYIEPMNAIGFAWDANQEAAAEAYGKVIESEGNRVGF